MWQNGHDTQHDTTRRHCLHNTDHSATSIVFMSVRCSMSIYMQSVQEDTRGEKQCPCWTHPEIIGMKPQTLNTIHSELLHTPWCLVKISKLHIAKYWHLLLTITPTNYKFSKSMKSLECLVKYWRAVTVIHAIKEQLKNLILLWVSLYIVLAFSIQYCSFCRFKHEPLCTVIVLAHSTPLRSCFWSTKQHKNNLYIILSKCLNG